MSPDFILSFDFNSESALTFKFCSTFSLKQIIWRQRSKSSLNWDYLQLLIVKKSEHLKLISAANLWPSVDLGRCFLTGSVCSQVPLTDLSPQGSFGTCGESRKCHFFLEDNWTREHSGRDFLRFTLTVWHPSWHCGTTKFWAWHTRSDTSVKFFFLFCFF